MTLVRIKDHPNLVRDIHSKALLNTDRNALEEYQARVEYARQQQAEKKETQMRLQKLEQNMDEIRSLLADIASMRKE
jgi:multidrug resistance efflux pump